MRAGEGKGEKRGRKWPKGRKWKWGKGEKGIRGGEVEGVGVDIAWRDLWLSLRDDTTAAASGSIWS